MTLKEFFTQIPKAALAFSGGTDSAYLLAQGLKLGADLRPYYMKTALQPAFELEDARRLCQQLGVELTVVELDLLALHEIRENGPERCYYCKKTLFSTLQERAAADGYPVVLDGTKTLIRKNAMFNWGNRITIRVLPPVPAAKVVSTETHVLMEEVHDAMSAALAQIRNRK